MPYKTYEIVVAFALITQYHHRKWQFSALPQSHFNCIYSYRVENQEINTDPFNKDVPSVSEPIHRVRVQKHHFFSAVPHEDHLILGFRICLLHTEISQACLHITKRFNVADGLYETLFFSIFSVI